MAKLVYLDGREQDIEPQAAEKLRAAWVAKRYANKAQAAFVETIQKIVYNETEEYCLHRYQLKQTIPMGRSNCYILQCPQCGDSYATDIEPVENYEQNSIDTMEL